MLGIIGAAAKRPLRDLELSLITNGTLLSERFLDLARKIRMNWLFVSLDAATAETYHAIRGGKFERVCEGIRRVTSHRPDIPVIIGFVVMRENYKEIPAFIRMAERLGVDFEFSPLNSVPQGRRFRRPGVSETPQNRPRRGFGVHGEPRSAERLARAGQAQIVEPAVCFLPPRRPVDWSTLELDNEGTFSLGRVTG